MKIDFYEINIPKGWVVKEDESITSFFNSQGFGALQISSFISPDKYKINLFDELYDFASDYVNIKNGFEQYKNIKEISCGLLIDEIIEKNRSWLFAILNNEQKLLLITYNSLIEDFYKEHDTILEIINSILF